ncbi:uncharacterized protein PV06_06864 [Exophiala oligosperma]|uniref:Heterokaryon incompatibility domain-containing protein n=1 Tax=Exophiala oligosperma TaxID=215243 RepID=A0A0D2BV00_9EURO|nr:uncharacterized protein PV06_06864 [Exophiala oligosperma]KIW41292.1 hypothetical protein PV06_06864 [Exophiala oligosperma]
MRWKLQKVKYHPRGKGFKVELQRPETSQLKLRDVVIGKNRCDFCALLYNFITGAGAMQDELLDKRIVLSSYRDDRVRDDFEMELAINGIRVAFQDHDQIELETKYPVLCQYLPLTKVPGPSGFQFSDDASHAPSPTDIVKRIKLEKSCDGADLAHFIPGEAPTPPEEQVVYAKARAWLDCCKKKHRSCRRGLPGRLYGSIKDVQDKSALPFRAVFVGAAEGGAPYLIETGGICAEYATLSYCWGEALGAAGSGAAGWPHVTLTSNLEERLGGAPLDAMPRTIQHAILICQRLGLQYLWVDCLCIVQDDRADWNRESSKMREIYEQSTVTIVALGAKDIYQGCFFPRPPTHVSDSRGEHPGTGAVSLPFIVDDTYLGTVYAYPPPHGPDFHEVLDSVWNTRGWTFQERALSRRLLYFGRHQLLWECQKCRWTEDNTHNFNMNSPGRADNELEDEGGLKKSISAAVMAVNFVGGSQDLADDLQAMGHKVTVSLYRAAILLIAWPVKKGRAYVDAVRRCVGCGCYRVQRTGSDGTQRQTTRPAGSRRSILSGEDDGLIPMVCIWQTLHVAYFGFRRASL